MKSKIIFIAALLSLILPNFAYSVLPNPNPTSTWNPKGTTNGWNPKLSPNGRYAAYGFGEVWVADLQTGQEFNFSNQPGTKSCSNASWISSNTITFSCELTNATAKRYEVKIGQWIANQTSDDSNLVSGNLFEAADGHWASWLTTPGRIAKDNQVLVATGAGGAIAISQNQLVHACDPNNSQICLWQGNNLSSRYTPKTPLHQMTINNGYIVYGGFGPIRGIDPAGSDIDLSASNPEILGQVFFVNNQAWVASFLANQGTIFLRPWGQKNGVSIKGDASGLSVVFNGTDFIVAFNSDRGALTVQTIPGDQSIINPPTGGQPPPGEPVPAPGPGPTNGGFPNIPIPLYNVDDLVEEIFRWSLSLVGIAIFFAFVYAGWLYLTAAGRAGQIGKAKEVMLNALIGAIILLSAYLILYTINPDLVKQTLTLPGL